MANETVYIKVDKNVEVTKPEVTLGDVIQMECPNPAIVPRLKSLKLLTFHHTDDKHQNRVAISILKVIERIHEECPNVDVQNLGETDFIVGTHALITGGLEYRRLGLVVTDEQHRLRGTADGRRRGALHKTGGCRHYQFHGRGVFDYGVQQ